MTLKAKAPSNDNVPKENTLERKEKREKPIVHPRFIVRRPKEARYKRRTETTR